MYVLFIILVGLLLIAVGITYLLHSFIKQEIQIGRFEIIDKAIRMDQYTNEALVELYKLHYEEFSDYTKKQIAKEFIERRINIADYV